jgi:hypothetical protein
MTDPTFQQYRQQYQSPSAYEPMFPSLRGNQEPHQPTTSSYLQSSVYSSAGLSSTSHTPTGTSSSTTQNPGQTSFDAWGLAGGTFDTYEESIERDRQLEEAIRR